VHTLGSVILAEEFGLLSRNNSFIPRLTNILRNEMWPSYNEYKSAGAALAVSIFHSGRPVSWQPWVVATLIAGRGALLRYPPCALKPYFNADLYKMLEAWISFNRSGEALTVPYSAFSTAIDGRIGEFLAEIQTMVSSFVYIKNGSD
jgi:hypothetical protein